MKSTDHTGVLDSSKKKFWLASRASSPSPPPPSLAGTGSKFQFSRVPLILLRPGVNEDGLVVCSSHGSRTREIVHARSRKENGAHVLRAGDCTASWWKRVSSGFTPSMLGSVRDGDGSKDSFRLHVCASQLDVARLESS
jgi:hypothetical protein